MSYSHFISFTKVDDLFRSFRSKRLRVILYFIIIFFLQGTAQDKTHTLHSCLVLFFGSPELWKRKRRLHHEQQHMCDLNSLALLFLLQNYYMYEREFSLPQHPRKAYSTACYVDYKF